MSLGIGSSPSTWRGQGGDLQGMGPTQIPPVPPMARQCAGNRSNLSLCELRQFGFGSSPVETGRFGRPPCDGSAVDSSRRQRLGHSAGALHNALNSQSFGCAEHCFWGHFFFSWNGLKCKYLENSVSSLSADYEVFLGWLKEMDFMIMKKKTL